ncbi:MAG: hypothetical protein JNL23_11495, partial [Chitinophagaceae bacterium]|nr:hypothetical protein [Chitinophagaceae bacterium]
MIATHDGIDMVKPDSSILLHFSKDQSIEAAPLRYSVAEDSKGRIWQAKPDSGLEVLDIENNTLLKMSDANGLSEKNISSLFNDNRGQMWIGTETGGINIINNNISINHLSVNQGLSDNEVWSLLEDDNGNVWAGNTKGIDIINIGQHYVKQLGAAIQMGEGYGELPKTMKDKDGCIWAYSNRNALSVMDIKKKTVKIYQAKNLPFRNGSEILGDRQGRVWISAAGQGVLLFDTKANVFRHINASNGLAGNLVWRMLEDKDGRIWIATSKGLNIIEPDASGISTIHKDDGLSDNVTQSLVQDEQGRMWVSTNEGVDMIDLSAKTVTAFTKKQGMTENESYALETLDGKIYAGTSSGINIIENIGSKNNSHWQVKTFERPQGFYFVDVNSNTSLLSKQKQFFWGIQFVLTVMNAPVDDSLINPAHITGIAINGQQQYFFNSSKELKALPDSIWSERSDTFYNKENIKNNFGRKNQLQYDSSIGLFNMPAGLKLAYNQNQVSFQFTGIHTDNAEKARYRFILEGLDKQWSAVTKKAQSPDYNNLSPGSYNFKVITKGANNLWSQPATFSFTILPPWWQTWWAYLLYALVALSVIRAYVMFRSRRLQKENLMLEQKVEQRTIELKQSLNELKSTQSQLIQSEKMASLGELTAGIAHEIQNPLNFVNNFSEVNKELIDELQTELNAGKIEDAKAIANDIKENEEKINHHGKRADAIVKGMLQHSRTSSVQKELTDINTLCDEYLRLAYHGLRAKDKSFNVTMKTDFDETIGKINVVPQDIGRVILNLITNAFYAVNEKKKQQAENYEPTIFLKTKKHEGKIEVSVKDNGIGIPQQVIDKIFQPFFTTKPTGQGTGLGLSLSYDIVKAHGGELTVSSKQNQETIFTITLPTT